jgi:hypothetical protein
VRGCGRALFITPALPAPTRNSFVRYCSNKHTQDRSSKTRGSQGKKEEDRKVDVPLACLETVTSVHSKQCVFITVGPIIKMRAGGEGDSEQGHVL